MNQPTYVCPTCGSHIAEVQEGQSIECDSCQMLVTPIQATRAVPGKETIDQARKQHLKDKTPKQEKVDPLEHALLKDADDSREQMLFKVFGTLLLVVGIASFLIWIIPPARGFFEAREIPPWLIITLAVVSTSLGIVLFFLKNMRKVN